MKKLLSLLSVLTISGTAVPTTIAASPYQKEEHNTENLKRNKRQQLSCYNFDWLARTAISFYAESNKDKIIDFRTPIGVIIDNWQNKFYNNKTGLLKVINKETLGLESSKVWGHTFSNSSDKEQPFSTQAYDKTVTNTSTWNINMTLKESLKFNFFVGEGNVEFSINSGYTQTRTETETLRVPSQTFKVKPNSVADANIVLEKGKYKSTGILKFETDMSEQLHLYFDNNSYVVLSSLINHIIDIGKEMCINSNDENTNFKVLTVDNVNNPTHAYFNIPITWEWYGNNLIVNFTN